jgi:phosphatidate cytidylyltransferase
MKAAVADVALLQLFGGVFILLIVATFAGAALQAWDGHDSRRATIANVNARIRAWWVIAFVFGLSIATGAVGSILLFMLVSFLALREFVTIAPTRPADHRALFWCFFVVTPLEYALIWFAWYGLFSVLVPVYISIVIALRVVLAGDTDRFLERAATMQWGLTICVYFVSHVPALLLLRIPGHEGENARLVFFLVLVVQLSDVLQFVWGKTLGRRAIAPSISANKTWAGFVGGTLSATAVGTALWWATPFTPAAAATMAFVVTITGFAGGLIMSAIKRGSGVKDYGSLIAGHGGILDRIDSLCFAAPVFFHLTKYFFST